jgi:toxin ParE1/3/4
VKRFRLTPRALKDLDEIADYSLAQWGEKQTERYLVALEDRFRWLADNPLLGRARDDIAEGYRSFPARLALGVLPDFWRRDSIIGVPHASMDVDAYFDEPS